VTSRNRLAVSGGDWDDSTFARVVTEGSAMSADPYAELCALPEHLTGEILNGVLHTQPRPAGPHALAASALGAGLFNLRQRSGGGGGWWIIDEPEVHFIRDTEVCVPDIGGWRRCRVVIASRSCRTGFVKSSRRARRARIGC